MLFPDDKKAMQSALIVATFVLSIIITFLRPFVILSAGNSLNSAPVDVHEELRIFCHA
jgi:hypothetical protein